jgi:mono/diheme cytochrome c family protein
MPGIALVDVAVSRPNAADAISRFRVEVPDVDASRFAGLAELVARNDNRALPSAAQGRRLYEANCAQCHGAGGEGDGPAARGMTPPPANLALHARWHPDAQLEWLIANGLPGTAMEGFGERLDAGQVRDIVAHLRSLDRGGAAPGRKP